jgi:hypothetical protein
MMLEGTNIVIDKFGEKSTSFVKYLYFLSHFHTGNKK